MTGYQCKGYKFRLFTFKQQIPKFSKDALPYSVISLKPLKIEVIFMQTMKKCYSDEKQYCCYFLMLI